MKPQSAWSSRLNPTELMLDPGSAEQFWLSGETDVFLAMIELSTDAVPLPIASPPPKPRSPESLNAIVLVEMKTAFSGLL